MNRIAILALLAVLMFGASANAHPDSIDRVSMVLGRVALEVTGQVDNSATPAPLGSSTQFGYLSFVNGIPSIFTDSNPANQNEHTAVFTFVTQVDTERVTANAANGGPFSIVIRTGTTTVYLASSGADFTDQASFESGTPIQVSEIRQQVIVDNSEKTFTVENLNTITSSMPFTLNGSRFQLGNVGEGFRTSLVGVLTVRSGATPPPTGYFGGYAVGVARVGGHQ
jgi:hypothetical protein